MTGRDAMIQALVWAKTYPWGETDIHGRWETRLEMMRLGKVECDGHFLGCLEEFSRLCREEVPQPWPEAFFVIGTVPHSTDPHAWIGYRENADTPEDWGDPTPGYVAGLHGPGTWNRTPTWGFPLNIEDGVPVLPGFPYERRTS